MHDFYVFSALLYFVYVICTREMDSKFSEKLISFEQSMNFFNEQFELVLKKVKLLEEENQGLKLENSVLKSQVATMTENMSVLEARLDDQEQYQRSQCLEFKGIPAQEDEDTNDIVTQVAQLVGVDLNEEDISVSHRLPARNAQWKGPPSPPVIIAKFTRRDIKDKIYKARFKLKNKTSCDLDFDGTDHNNSLYISESLTQTRKKTIQILSQAKEGVKACHRCHIAATSLPHRMEEYI